MKASASPWSDTGPSLKRRAWLFAAPAIAGLVAVLLLFAHRQGAFSTEDRLHFLAPSALGISAGMPAKLNGFVVGSVREIVLLPPSADSPLRVRVELGIYKDYMRYIPKATVARLLQEGLIGQSVIELQPRRYDARPVASGEVLGFERSRNVGEIAEHLEQQLAPVLASTRSLGAGLADPDGDFQQALKGARMLAEALPATNAQARQTLAQASAGVDQLSQAAARTLGSADRSLATVSAAVPGLLEKLDRTAGNLAAASDSLRVVGGASEEALPGILGEVRQLSGDGRRVVDGALGSWPLRTMVAPAPEALPLDSQQGLDLPYRTPR
ncbi:MlaD family protein [Massilia niastensis]|uniref:MlaD family protein n=1 Tax=Massilia niastensis TaxID=544911 RepID=UPI00036BEE21|nr:MlaD family protein [Massilia niastensis]